jgi:hypothetical protein
MTKDAAAASILSKDAAEAPSVLIRMEVCGHAVIAAIWEVVQVPRFSVRLHSRDGGIRSSGFSVGI